MIHSKITNKSLTWSDMPFQYYVQHTNYIIFNSDELYYFPKLHPLSDQTSRATTQIFVHQNQKWKQTRFISDDMCATDGDMQSSTRITRIKVTCIFKIHYAKKNIWT